MNRQLLELQADRIEAVLTLHNMAARVTGGTVTPRWVRFQVLPTIGTKLSRITGLSEELAAALDTSNCRVSRRGAAVTVEVPRDDPQPVRLLPLYRQLTGSPRGGVMDDGAHLSIPPVTAILGLGEDGTPLLVRLPSPDVAHVLVAGTTGSGKTVLLRAMALSLALRHPSSRDLNLVLIDPRAGAAFDCLASLPHLARSVIRDTEEAGEVLASLLRLMEMRDRKRVNAPPVIVMIDELTDLVMVGGQAMENAITRLLQRGRGAGLHVVAATQKPTAAVIGSLVKALFPVRVVGKVTSSEDARVASGWSGTGAERLLGRGDFLVVAEGRVIRFQAAHVSEKEIGEVLAARGWTAPSPQLDRQPVEAASVIILPEPAPEPDPVDTLAGRLRAHGWRGGPINDAFRLLFPGATPGGRRYTAVKTAVEQITSTSASEKPPHASDEAWAFSDDGSGSGSERESEGADE
jgi:S-DNA-T family DNA segregation ATPase FtsK/SpoIIIE